MPNLVIGVDVGTSSTKTLLTNTHGEVLASTRWEYPMYRPYPGWAENDPDDWVDAVESSVRLVIEQAMIDPARVKGICIVAQRDPSVLLDERQQVLTPSISWIDRRDLDEAEQVYDEFDRKRLIETTGLVPVPALPLPNIYWIRRHKPDIWSQTRRILAPKDYVLLRLTGKVATDISTPSRSMLYDLRKRNWSEWICQKAGIDIGLLPPVVFHPWDVWEELSPTAARRLGLFPGTILAAGGGDDPCAALGAGAIEVGDTAVGTGTATCWRAVTDRVEPDLSSRADLSPHVVPGRYVYELVVTGTGTSLRWFKDTFGARSVETQDTYQSLLQEASQAPAGSDGLFYYPYLEGARAPHFNDDATGVFFGILGSHTRAHCIRAILEGIAFQYPPVLRLIEHYSGKVPNTIILVDDEARNPLWNQIKADVTGRVIQTPKVLYAAAMGAAILASLAAGLFPNAAAAVHEMIKPGESYLPNPNNQEIYRQALDRYERVYAYLNNAFRSVKRSVPA